MIYHLLTESEPFSEQFGGAISRWVANVLRDDPESRVVCPWADRTWGFSPERVVSLANLKRFRRFSNLVHHRRAIRQRLAVLPYVLNSFSKTLRCGDTVYVHNRPEFAIALGAIRNCKNVKLVLHMHNSHLSALPENYRLRLPVDGVVFCSQFLRSEIEDSASDSTRTVVIPNGADESAFYPVRQEQPVDNRTPVVLFVGRLVPDKGVHTFVNAMRLLKQKRVDVIGRIVGETEFGSNRSTPYVNELKRQKPENVEFLSYISGEALGIEFRRANIFCCPSLFNEPFGMVNVEAMASALPVVASAVGGIPEVFREGGAVLFPRGSETELANAIEDLIRNPQKRRELSQQGYLSFKKNYRWQNIRAKYQDFIGSLGACA
jgi:spore coat protein SA